MQKFTLIALVLLSFSLFAQKASKKCASDDFTGMDRKMAKTTISPKSIEYFNDLESFIKTLPEDKVMSSRRPPISNNPYYLRVIEEDRNVQISDVYLYAVTRQADNDFLLILGSSPDYKTAVYFNVEVSGLPDRSKDAYSVLNSVRTKLVDKYGNVCGKPLFLKENPAKVSVSGSLLYDINQKPGKADPKKLKTTTAWEIHPVTEIIFKD
jgi:hypothetical protein